MASDAQKHLERAARHVDAGAWQEAVEAYDALLAAEPDQVDALIGKAEILVVVGRAAEAFELFERVLGSNPDHPRALRGKAAAIESAAARSEADADHVLDEEIHLADTYRRDNDPQRAIDAYDRVLEHHPDEPRATAGRAEALRMAGRLEESLVWFDRTLELRPRLSSAVCGKAAALNGLQRFEEALPLWLMALRAHPAAPFVRRGLAQARSRVASDERSRAGVANDGRALPVPASPTTLTVPRADRDRRRARHELDRGRDAYRERDFPTAIRHFELALRLDPTLAEAALRLGMAFEDDRQFGKAIASYERCLTLDPNHHQAATNIGEANRKHERYEEAIAAYDRALALRPDYLYALAGRAECMRMLGDHEGCLSWFDRALLVGARHAFAVQGKAAALNTLGRHREAWPLWEKALEIEPGSLFAKEGKAVCERHMAEQPEEEEPTSPTPTLDEQGRDLSALAREGRLSPVVGREDEIRAVMKTLVRRLKANPLLLGDPGVGKTAVVEGVAQALVKDDAPARLRGLRIVELSMGSLLAGTKYRGTFEERLKDIVREAKDNPGIVLFIDEIHTLVGAGRTEGGSLDAANILKPALARGEITVIGATTVAEYRKHFESDAALDRRFQPLHVEEPSERATVDLLRRITPLYEQHHGVRVRPETLQECVRLAVRFVPDRRLPDKALDLLDEACADASLNHTPDLGERPWVEPSGVAVVVSDRTGIPVTSLTEAERSRLDRLEDALETRVIGQHAAVRELAAAVRLARSGLRDPHRPRGVFLFAGASGVGKTELARALADVLFPEGATGRAAARALVKLDMSEFGDRFTASRLLGAPPGYQGHGEEGQLTGPLRRRPYAVVLLDEFEKAHPDVQAVFLSLFDEGVVTDAEGRTVHAREAFFVLTTNAGSEVEGRGRLGFGNDTPEARRDIVLAAARRHFRPELLNRLDGIVAFRDLDDGDLERIVAVHLARLATRAADGGALFTWDPGVAAACVRHRADPSKGARAALRALEDLVSEPLGKLVLAGAEAVHAAVDDGRVTLVQTASALV